MPEKYRSPRERFSAKLNQARPALLACIRGEEACDWHIKGGNVLNLFTGKVAVADVWVKDGFIALVTDESEDPILKTPMFAKSTYDATGLLILPGFVDSHMHIESTMLTPYEVGKVLALTGTTSIITDPHEICNVTGIDGLTFMLESAKDSPIRQYALVPSCVPSVPGLENAGASWDAAEIEKCLSLGLPNIAGLAEMMSYLPVIYGDDRFSKIVETANNAGAFVQGHYFGLGERSLAAYILAGGKSNHENLSYADIIQAITSGMQVDLRLTSSLVVDSRDSLIQAVLDSKYHEGITLCTDDVHARDILDGGHINRAVRLLIEAGVEQSLAVRMASLHAWRGIGVDCAGAVAPGHIADLQFLKMEEQIGTSLPTAVFVDGEKVVDNSRLVKDVPKNPSTLAFEKRNTVNLSVKTPENFAVLAPNGQLTGNVLLRTIKFEAGNVLNTEGQKELPLVNGAVSIAGQDNLAWGFVLNRYDGIKTGIALLEGYELKEGAIASTISHDCHNLVVVFKDANAAALATNALIACGGGLAYVNGKLETKTHPLPVGGLMSAEDPGAVANRFDELEAFYMQSHGTQSHLMSIVTLALAVIPQYRISDLGIVDVMAEKIIPLFL